MWRKILSVLLLGCTYLYCVGQEVRLGLPLGHLHAVVSANFNPDDSQILTASYDGTAKLFDVKSGKLLQDFRGHTDGVNTAVFSPDGSQVLTASHDGTAKLFDVKSGKLLQDFRGHTDGVNTAVFSPDGSQVLTASHDNTAKLFDTKSGVCLQNYNGHRGGVNSAVFSSDGSQVLTASWDSTAKLFDLESGIILQNFSGHKDGINCAIFSPDGDKVLTASWDKTAKLFSVNSGQNLQNYRGHTDWVISANFNSKGNQVLTASNDKTAKLFNTESGEIIQDFKEHHESVRSAEFSPDETLVLTSSYDGTCLLFDAKTGERIQKFSGHNDMITSASFGSDGGQIVSSSNDKTAKLFNIKTGEIIQNFKQDVTSVKSAHYSKDGTKVLIADDSGVFSEIDINTGELIRKDDTSSDWVLTHSFPVILVSSDSIAVDANLDKLSSDFDGNESKMRSGVFSSDSSTILIAEDRQAMLFNVKTGGLLQTFKVNDNWINSAIFSPDGSQVITASNDSFAYIFDIKSGELVQNFRVDEAWITSAIISPDGSKVLTLSKGWLNSFVQLFDANTGKLLKDFDGHEGQVNSALFSPDGSQVLSTSVDGSVVLQSVTDLTQHIQRFTFDGDPTIWVHLHPSGLFNASPEAMQKMFWTKGLEIIEFEQLKARYWLPGLWEKVFSGESLPNVRDIGNLKLQPEVILGEIRNGVVPITLRKREGGYGQISVFINGKEIVRDARGSKLDTSLSEQTIGYSILNHPSLLQGLNTISVKASSEDGFVQGRGAEVVYHKQDENEVKPSFFGVVIGVSKYANSDIDLVYPDRDAKAIAASIQTGALNLFDGRAKTYVLSSSEEIRPTKANIKRVFEEIHDSAKAEDIVFVYLAGHGVTWGIGSESDFYFLTSDAVASNKEAFTDPQIRQNRALSTNEMVEWLKDIAAQKQVMIIDACGSGQAVENLITSRDVEGSQIKAMDRMKDRTGMYVLSGCAADAVSYEASQYGQGLLTYSILEGLSGKGLKGENVDVFTIMNYAREKVPELAANIGGVQVPQLLMPRTGSFDIGILSTTDQASIPLANKKQVYIRSSLVNPKQRYRDSEGLGILLDEALELASQKVESTAVFFDVKEYKNACQISGSYNMTENGIQAEISVMCGNVEHVYKAEGRTKQKLIESIINTAGL